MVFSAVVPPPQPNATTKSRERLARASKGAKKEEEEEMEGWELTVLGRRSVRQQKQRTGGGEVSALVLNFEAASARGRSDVPSVTPSLRPLDLGGRSDRFGRAEKEGHGGRGGWVGQSEVDWEGFGAVEDCARLSGWAKRERYRLKGGGTGMERKGSRGLKRATKRLLRRVRLWCEANV